MSNTATITPVIKTLSVDCDVERAFTVFTREIGSWWPTDTHSLNPGEVEQVVWEEREGGCVYEIATNGTRAVWATVLAWEPPHRFVIAWQVNPDRLGTEIEVSFTSDGAGTRVELEHRGWENLAEGGAEMRAGYDSGWDMVLAGFTAAAA